MELWKTIAWSPEQEQVIYREWALFCTKKQNVNVADLYYNKALALKPDDSKALYYRSQCKRHIAQTKGALADAKHALALDDLRQPFNLEVCDAEYELNEFEQTKSNLENFSRKFTGKKVKAFHNRLAVLDGDFKATLGSTLGYFILKNEKYFYTAHREMMRIKQVDKRPLYKILLDKQECDADSIPEKKIEMVDPREIARQQRAFRIFNQIYFGKNWTDVMFLKGLKNDKNLLLPQSQLSKPLLKNLTEAKYGVVKGLVNMLHARCPLYTKLVRNAPDSKYKKQKTETYLYGVQYQVRRSMKYILNRMHYLRATRNIDELRRYLEEVMGDYVVLKTHRVMPWKFQFINEVYNLLALALCDRFDEIPANLDDLPQQDRLVTLLKLPTDLEEKPVPYEFGKRETFANVSGTEKAHVKWKVNLARLMKRLKFAKYHIEKAYLWHQVARCYLKINMSAQCLTLARKCIAEAALCNSNVWMLLGMVLICRTHARLRERDKITAILQEAAIIAHRIDNKNILNFLKVCKKVNQDDIKTKKVPEVKRFMSKNSMHRSSIFSNKGLNYF